MLVLADQKISQPATLSRAKPRKGFSSAQPKLIELGIKFSHENFDPQIEDGGIQFSISLTEMFILASQKPHQLHLSHEKLHTETYTLQEKHNKKTKRKLFRPGLRYHRYQEERKKASHQIFHSHPCRAAPLACTVKEKIRSPAGAKRRRPTSLGSIGSGREKLCLFLVSFIYFYDCKQASSPSSPPHPRKWRSLKCRKTKFFLPWSVELGGRLG